MESESKLEKLRINCVVWTRVLKQGTELNFLK